MPFSRRRFLQSGMVLGTGAFLDNLEKVAASVPKPAFAGNVPIKILATNWGFEGGWEAFCTKAKEAGYDGFEAWIPQNDKEVESLLDIAHKTGLEYGFLAGGASQDYKEHFKSYETAVRRAAAQKPLYVNTHAGRDYFSNYQNRIILEAGIRIAKETGVPVLCETHRGRAAFNASITREFMEMLPDLRLTADLSHWCVVHESLLEGYEEAVTMALSRTEHIHARIGHSEGPQVSDPRAPEWAAAVKRHLEWWDRVIEFRFKAGAAHLTFLTEFGPPNYLPTLPYTRQPVANQWEINLHMMKILRDRYG